MKTTLTNMTWAALAIVFTIYSGCSPQAAKTSEVNSASATKSSSIVGGVDATIEFQKQNGLVGLVIVFEREVPVFVGGKITLEVIQETSLCTGTLIDRRIILTAAHCLLMGPEGAQLVGVAAYFKPDISTVTQEELFFADGADVSPDFLKGLDETSSVESTWNDIALIRLNQEAPADVQVVKRLASTDVLQLDASSSILLTGFGISTPIVRKKEVDPITGKASIVDVPEKTDSSGVLRLVEGIPFVSLNADNKEIKFSQLDSKGACHGDSGGPAFLKQADGSLIQIGVTSRGTDSLGNCNENSIYTNVLAHDQWITEASAKLLNPPAPTPVVAETEVPAEPVNP